MWKTAIEKIKTVSPCSLLTWVVLKTLRERDIHDGNIPFAYLNNLGDKKGCSCYVRGGVLAGMLPYRTDSIVTSKSVKKFISHYTKKSNQHDLKSFRFIHPTECLDDKSHYYYIVFISPELVDHIRPFFAQINKTLL
jgi:hypothetical protein